MPKKCCVIGCKSGYETNKEKVNTFKFPNDENLKLQWLVAIGRKDYKPSKWAAVCNKHFKEDDIIRHCVGVDPETGSEALFPARVKLQEGAIPALNLSNPNESKSKGKNEQREIKLDHKTRRPGRPRKISKLPSKCSSSEEDVPLETLKNRSLGAKADQNSSPTETVGSDSDTEHTTNNDKTLKRQFFDLLERYEHLKARHVSLGQEIDVLERVNIELKCKLFKF